MQTNSASPSQSSQATYLPSVPISLYREVSTELQSIKAKLASMKLQNEKLVKQNQLLVREFQAISQTNQLIQEAIAQSNKKLEDIIPPSAQSQSSEAIPEAKPIVQKQEINPPLQKQDIRPPAQKQEIKPPVQKQESKSPWEKQTIGQYMKREVAVKGKQPLPVQPQSNTEIPNHNPDAFAPVQPQVVSFTTPSLNLETYEEEPTPLFNPEPSGDGKVSGWWLAFTVLVIMLTSFGAGYLLMRPFTSK